MVLSERSIVLGITGSIAAFKGIELASRLTQMGAQVDVVLTPSATAFVTPLSLRALTGRNVYVDMLDASSELAVQHVEIARRADAVVIAPASATTVARMAHGLAEDMVSLTVLATRAPVLVAPAMDSQMWENVATQSNVALLKERGVTFVGHIEGRLATGRMGKGRFAELDDVVGAICLELGKRGDLAGRKVIISAGGTQEPIDPVRFVGNRSSGKMGYALAAAARDRGARVTLVSGPVSLPAPYGVEVRSVNTALEMRDAVREAVADADALIMAAAVADYRPEFAVDQKMKKTGSGLDLRLAPNPDILSEVQGPFVKVGFAAESQNLLENAAGKLRSKNADLFVANDITATDAGFGSEDNRVTIIDREGNAEALPLLPKYDVANRILDRVVDALRARE